MQPALHAGTPKRRTVEAVLGAIVRRSAADADWVAAMLDSIGCLPGSLDPDILLGLGAVARLHDWETRGLPLARMANLPTVEKALSMVADASEAGAVGPATDAMKNLTRRVFIVAVEHLASSGVGDSAEQLVVGMIDDEDELLNALAEMLWCLGAH